MTRGSKRASIIHRYCVILNVVLFFVIINAHAQQQTEDSEHASHHPEAANGPIVEIGRASCRERV